MFAPQFFETRKVFVDTLFIFLSEKYEGEIALKDAGDNERIILKWVLVKWNVIIWSRFIWLRMGLSGGQSKELLFQK